MKYGFGIDLGGTTVKLAYFDETGTMLDKWEIPTVTANGGAQILPDIAASVNGFVEDNKIDRNSLIGIGIGYVGSLIMGKLLLDEAALMPSAGIAVGAFLFSVVLGIVFGMYPAIKASGLQPVVALRAD